MTSLSPYVVPTSKQCSVKSSQRGLDMIDVFNEVFYKTAWSNQSFGGSAISNLCPEIVEQGKIPKQLKNITAMCIMRHMNPPYNSYNTPNKFFRKNKIKLIYSTYIPAESIHYYFIYTKDANLVKLSMTQEEQDDMEPVFFDLELFYNRLRTRKTMSATW